MEVIWKEHCFGERTLYTGLYTIAAARFFHIHVNYFKKNYQMILAYFKTHLLLICIKIPELALEQLTKAIEYLLCKHFVTLRGPAKKKRKCQFPGV